MSDGAEQDAASSASARAFAGTSKRAALMPYVMGGFPTLEESLRIGAGVRARRART